MKFNGKSGQELRTWILFFFGISLAAFFAWQKNPLNPWWTLIIGAFTCTAVIVSAVQALVGGIDEAAKRAVNDARRRSDQSRTEDRPDETSLSVILGPPGNWSYANLRRSHVL